MNSISVKELLEEIKGKHTYSITFKGSNGTKTWEHKTNTPPRHMKDIHAHISRMHGEGASKIVHHATGDVYDSKTGTIKMGK